MSFPIPSTLSLWITISFKLILTLLIFKGYFIDLARQIETFFIQKRFLVYSHKPELILREDSSELRAEIQRKDELIRRHYDKMAHWQSLLQDMKEQEQQQQTPPQNAPAGAAALPAGVKGQPGSPMQGLQPGPGPQGPVPQGAPGPSFGQPSPYRMNPPYQTPLASLEKTTTTIGR